MGTDIVILVIMAVLMVAGFAVWGVLMVVADKLYQEYHSMIDKTGVVFFLAAILIYVVFMLIFQNVFPALGWT